MLKRTTIILSVMLCMQIAWSQKKTRADRFYEKGDYINAAMYYETILAKTAHKKHIQRIAISYYNTFQYAKAARYLKQLIDGHFIEEDKTYDNGFNFKYYQTLSALGNYDTALDYLNRYKRVFNDSITIKDAIETIESFKLMDSDYTIDLAKFNSETSDFGAVKINDSIYFTSDRPNENFDLFPKTYKWTHQSFLDIYAFKTSEENATIGVPVRLSDSINSKLHEGNFCFSTDGKTLYVSKSNVANGKKVFDENGNNNIHIYKASFIDGAWSQLEKLAFNNDSFSYQHPALSPDGKHLYFSSNQNDSYGSFDIYVVDILQDNTYSQPKNLGPTINTMHREHFPFISKDGHLFFASNGHLGLGMLDNFVSEHVDGTFSTPINLGAPINSQYDDFSLNYHSENEGFFASNRNKSDDNIYHFKQIGEIFNREYINSFEVRDYDTDTLISNVNVQLRNKNGEEIYNNTLGDQLTFNKTLLSGKYTFTAQHPNYEDNTLEVIVAEQQHQKHILYLTKVIQQPSTPLDPVEAIISETNIDAALKEKDPKRFELLTDIQDPPVVEKEGRLFFELEPIYFDYNKWSIREDSKVTLEKLAKKLERYPNIHIKISAHTDSRGTEHYNRVLSEKRAEATRNYLALETYINARRLRFEGYGESTPAISCPTLECTEEEHQLNRRSEFEIIKY